MTENKEKRSLYTQVSETCEWLRKQEVRVSVRNARKRLTEHNIKIKNAELSRLVDEWRQHNKAEYEVKPSELTLKSYAADVKQCSEAVTSEIRQQNDDLMDDLEDLRSKYEEKEVEIELLRGQLEKATDRILHLERENSAKEVLLSQKDAEAARILSEVSVLTTEREIAKASDLKRQVEVAALANEAKSAKDLLLAERIQKETLQETEKALRAELAEYRVELSNMNLRAGTAEGKCIGLNEMITVLKDQLQKIHSEIQILSKLKGFAT